MRCVSVLGPSQTGKSTLVDKLAGLEDGAVRAATRSGLEIARLSYLDEAWALIDCPGGVEALGETHAALLASDAAILCVGPDPDAAVLAAPYLRAIEAAQVPCLVFVNQMDRANARLRDIVAALQDYAERPLILRQIPIREGDAVVGAVDLVSERAWRYRDDQPSKLIKIPAAASEREQEARAELLEHLSEYDDHLLEELIEDRTPPTEEVYAICARTLEERQAIPTLIGAAAQGSGLRRLMKALRHETPEVDALRARLAAKTEGEAAPIAVGFYAHHRPHIGKTVFLRALADGVAAGKPLGGAAIGSLQEPSDGGALAPGDIAAAVKSEHLHAGRLYDAAVESAPPGWARPPSPMLARRLTPAREKDEAKLSAALARLAAEDAALAVGREAQTGAHLAFTQGPLHLRRLRETFEEVFGVKTEPTLLDDTYRESISRPASTHYRHRKQSGGAGQFADVKLTVAPNPRGTGFTFEETVKGGAVPRNFIPAVEAGAREAMQCGPLGFPVMDVAVTLTDGQHHSVDSSDHAFRTAALLGVGQALAEAAPVLLRPIRRVDCRTPSVFSGALGPVISSLKGQVLGFDRDPDAKGWDVFQALLPESAIDELIAAVRGATQGVGWFESDLDHFEPLYGKEADKIVAARRSAAA